MGFAKGIKKMFGGASSKARPPTEVQEQVQHVKAQVSTVKETNGVDNNKGHVNLTAVDAKKAEKAQKKALRKMGKKGKSGKHVSTSFPSSPNSAEIRIPGRPYVHHHAKSPAQAGPSPAANGTVLGENRRATNVNSGSPMSSVPSPSTRQVVNKAPEGSRFFVMSPPSQKPQPRAGSGKYFSDEDSENNTPASSHGQKPLTKQYLSQLAAANATPPQHKTGGYLCSTDTPASSSDFCFSTDVEDEEYNRAKQYYEGNALMPEPSDSLEEESTLFGGDLGGEEESKGNLVPHSPMAVDSPMALTSSQPQNFSMRNPNLNLTGINSFGAKPGAGIFPDSSDSELDGEDMLPSPTALNKQKSRHAGAKGSGSTPSQSHPKGHNEHRNRTCDASPGSPLPKHPSKASRTKKAGATGFGDDGFGFQDFVVNAWPDQDANKANGIISFDDAFGQDPFAAQAQAQSAGGTAVPSSGTKNKRRERDSHRKKKSGGSVSSAPLVDPTSSQRGQSSARGSRSVAPTASARHASYRASPTSGNHSHLLDKLERDLREKHGQGGPHTNARSTTTPNRHRRNRSTPVSPLVVGQLAGEGHGHSDDDRNKDPDNWLMNEVADTFGPRGDAADVVSLSGRSTRSKADRSISGRSHKSRSTVGRRHASGSSRQKHSSGTSVASRNSHYSQRSHMSEASKSVANDLLRLEMQLAMVGKGDGNGSVAELVNNSPAAQSGGGGGSIAGGSVRSRRTTRSKSSRASPTASGARNRKSVVAPPGKLGLILANKPDGRGTVVSGVRPTSALVEKISTGDRIIAVDGEDVSHMNVSELTTIMTRKSDFDRKLTVVFFPPASQSGVVGLPHAHARGR
jgi:hypothetical protein